MRKHILALLTALCLLVGMLPAPALAAEPAESGTFADSDVSWEFQNGTLTFTGTGPIPDRDNTEGRDYCDGKYVKNIVIGDGITRIGDYAFTGCSTLKSVTIPDSVEAIGRYAFGGCNGLDTVTIPSSVKTIGERAFQACKGLDAVTIICNGIGPDIGNYAFGRCTYLISIEFTGNVRTIEANAFAGCFSLQTLSVPGDVGTIGTKAFAGCYHLTTLNVAGSVTAIDEAAFHDGSSSTSSSLTSVTVTGSVGTIGRRAFAECAKLETVNVAGGIETIGESAFADCTSLTSITLDKTKTIGASAFAGCTSLISVELPEDVEIGEGAFDDSGMATSGKIPNTDISWAINDNDVLTFTGTGAIPSLSPSDTPNYRRNKKITEIVIESGITEIGDYAFAGCSEASSVSLPESLTGIGNYAFAGCSSLTSVTIPESVKTIGRDAFAGCSGVRRVVINGTVDTIGYMAFAGCSALTSVEVAGSVTTVGESAFAGNRALTSVTVTGSVGTIEQRAFSGCDNLNTVSVTGSVEAIGEYAFAGCSELTSITLNETKEIGASAFVGCNSLTSVEVTGNNVTAIGESAFTGNRVLTSVTVNGGVGTVGQRAFAGCVKLETVNVAGGIETIGDYAFAGCSALTSITLDKTKTIGASAFADCISLTSAKLPEGVEIGEGAFENSGMATSGKIPNTNISWTINDNYVLTFTGTGVIPDLFESDIPSYPRNEEITKVVIEPGITGIGDNAFAGCTALTTVTLPDDMYFISDYAFAGCESLTAVTIPASVEYIGSYAFAGCTSLTSINLPENVEIGEGAFEGSGVTLPPPTSGKIPNTNIRWTINDSYVLTFTGTGAIPDLFESDTPSYPCNEEITAVVIEPGITGIGNYAFAGCESLTAVTLPDDMYFIGNYAFAGCTSLTSINLPENVEIGEGAFEDSGVGDTLVIFSGVMPGTNINCLFTAGGTLTLSGTGMIPEDMIPYSVRSQVKRAVIENGITGIDKCVFNGCYNLESVVIPDSVKTIGDSAFSDCYQLETVEIPAGVESIGDRAFYNSGLVAVEIPGSVKTIGREAFADCERLESVAIGEGMLIIRDYAFASCPELRTVSIPDSVACLGMDVFYDFGNESEIEVQLPQSDLDWSLSADGTLTVRGTGAMLEVPWQNQEDWESDDDGIRDRVNRVVIENGITGIGAGAFADFNRLTSVEIPNSVNVIGDGAFAYCNRLESVEIPNSVVIIGEAAFYDCGSLGPVSIPGSVKSVGRQAFAGCRSLTSLELAEGVETVGPEAFSWCPLTVLILPESISFIDAEAFEHNDYLRIAVIPGNLKYMAYSAFSDCCSLEALVFQGSQPPQFIEGNRQVDATALSMDYTAPVDFPHEATIYVPTGAKEAYQAVLGDRYKIAEGAPSLAVLENAWGEVYADEPQYDGPPTYLRVGEPVALKVVTFPEKTPFECVCEKVVLDENGEFRTVPASQEDITAEVRDGQVILTANKLGFYKISVRAGDSTTFCIAEAWSPVEKIAFSVDAPVIDGAPDLDAEYTIDPEEAFRESQSIYFDWYYWDVNRHDWRYMNSSDRFWEGGTYRLKLFCGNNWDSGPAFGYQPDAQFYDILKEHYYIADDTVVELNGQVCTLENEDYQCYITYEWGPLQDHEHQWDEGTTEADGYHWHGCTVPGCEKRLENFSYDPDLQAIVCNYCGYRQQVTLTPPVLWGDCSLNMPLEEFISEQGLAFEVVLANRDPIHIPVSEDMISGYDSSKEGLCQITINFGGRGFSAWIFVVNPDRLNPESGHLVIVDNAWCDWVSGPGIYAPGDQVTVSVGPRAGYDFVGWDDGANGTVGLSDPTQQTVTFTMPDEHVYLRALWQKRTGDVPEHQHQWSSDWTSDSSGHWKACSGCGEKLGLEAHTPGEWIIDKAATAAEAGSRHKACTVCGYVTETETIPATGTPAHQHSWASSWSYDSQNHWKACSGCEEKLELEAHTPGEWIIDKAATAAEAGSRHKACTVCGYTTQTETIPAVGGGSGTSGGSSSSSNGGSSSGSSTSTTRNPDGSTTQTQTKADGTKVETTIQKDGGKTVVETKKDGTVTTTETDQEGNKAQTVEKKDGSSITTIAQKDGTTATVSTSADSQVEAEVKLSTAAVSGAQQSGGAISLPIQKVQAVRSIEAAPSVTVSTGSPEPVKVEIPAAATPGTVAVLVKDDGTEEIIKTTALTENGIAVPLTDGATVKIIENSKDFADVSDENWAADAVDFASSRELFSGTSEDTFSPDTPMTRAMMMTVLANLDGQEVSGGTTWYEKSVEWAMAQGISDGSNPDGNISREQLAVMLWKYSGSPAVAGTLSGYADVNQVSDYAKTAMQWAVENGIISGYPDERLGAQDSATRAQVAQMLKNYIEKV